MSRRRRPRGRRVPWRDPTFEGLLAPYRRRYRAVEALPGLAAAVRAAVTAPVRRRRRLLATVGLAASLGLVVGLGWLHAHVDRRAEAAPGLRSGMSGVRAAAAPIRLDPSAEARLGAVLATVSYLPCPPEPVVAGWLEALVPMVLQPFALSKWESRSACCRWTAAAIT